MRQAPAISPAAARPIIPAIPVATDSDTRPGDGNAPYPRIPPTARPTRYHLLSPTARQGGHTPQYRPPYRLWRPPRLSTLPPTATTGRGMATPLSAHFPNCRADQMPSALPHSAAGVHTPRYHPPYRLLRPASLSPLLPTAMPGWGMATPPIRAFPQRRPARATPCKPKGSVLPRFIGPGGRARRAKKCIGLRVGGAKRVAASKAALPPKKRLALFPSQLSFKEQWLWQSAKKGRAMQRPVPAPRRPMQNPLPFPAPLPNRRGYRPTPCRLPMPPPLSWVAGPSAPHRRSAPSPTPSPVRPRQTPLPPMERPISPRGPAARNRNRGQTRQGQNFPPPGQGKFCLPR